MEGVTRPLPEVTELRIIQEAPEWMKAEGWGAEVGLRLAGDVGGALRGERPHPGYGLLVWSVAESSLG